MARTAAYDDTGGPGGLVGTAARTSILVYAAVVLV